MFEKMGGRKFFMSLIIVTAGCLIEVYGDEGLSTNMAGLLAAIYATYSASNAIITTKTAGLFKNDTATVPESIEQLDLKAPEAPPVSEINNLAVAIANSQAAQQETLQTLQVSMANVHKLLVAALSQPPRQG